MHAPAPTPAPDRPRNLAPELRPALERLGFVVQVIASPAQTLLMATWLQDEHSTYRVLYIYHAATDADRPLSYVSVQHWGRPGVQDLVTDTHVCKLAEVRHLLLNNRKYKAARQAALDAGTLLPADQLATR
ncbi:hypothetical protein Q5H93_12300 [Hymenobacter sp. ASUV-10]|uniref:Uncharacterized protein n=1 Tax=Hymenobacter aranciens TaxID=3063996 RepID=A0ABT9BFT8_9BACT|nr:hypothetical protein [Hymenobacter sp. ASUV-10]MDO7875516.1 hypothetical protein [Hymenobacter sp. ASUV-10]